MIYTKGRLELWYNKVEGSISAMFSLALQKQSKDRSERQWFNCVYFSSYWMIICHKIWT